MKLIKILLSFALIKHVKLDENEYIRSFRSLFEKPGNHFFDIKEFDKYFERTEKNVEVKAVEDLAGKNTTNTQEMTNNGVDTTQQATPVQNAEQQDQILTYGNYEYVTDHDDTVPEQLPMIASNNLNASFATKDLIRKIFEPAMIRYACTASFLNLLLDLKRKLICEDQQNKMIVKVTKGQAESLVRNCIRDFAKLFFGIKKDGFASTIINLDNCTFEALTEFLMTFDETKVLQLEEIKHSFKTGIVVNLLYNHIWEQIGSNIKENLTFTRELFSNMNISSTASINNQSKDDEHNQNNDDNQSATSNRHKDSNFYKNLDLYFQKLTNTSEKNKITHIQLPEGLYYQDLTENNPLSVIAKSKDFFDLLEMNTVVNVISVVPPSIPSKNGELYNLEEIGKFEDYQKIIEYLDYYIKQLKTKKILSENFAFFIKTMEQKKEMEEKKAMEEMEAKEQKKAMGKMIAAQEVEIIIITSEEVYPSHFECLKNNDLMEDERKKIVELYHEVFRVIEDNFKGFTGVTLFSITFNTTDESATLPVAA